MKTISLRCAVMIAVLSLLVSCGGGGGGSDTPTCTPNGNISLHTSSTTTDPLLGLTISIARGVGVHTFPVFVRYTSPPVAAIAAGYTPGTADPRTSGWILPRPDRAPTTPCSSQ